MNNYPVRNPAFRLVRHVRNEVIFQVRDIDRKPVSYPSTDTVTINIVDALSDTLVMSRNLVVADLNKGVYQLIIQAAEMDTWPTGPLRWSMLHHSDASAMLWTDQSYSPTGTVFVTEAPLPGPAPTISLGWNDFTLVEGLYYSPALPGAAQDSYVNGLQTVGLLPSDFTGTVRIDGTGVAQPAPDDWTAVFTQHYVIHAMTVINVPGDFQWLRVVVDLQSGSLDQVSYKA